MDARFALAYFGWLLYIVACFVFNYVKITKFKIRPRYFVSNQWRVFFGLVFLILLTVRKDFDPASNFFYQIWKVSPEIVYIVSSFYLFFDLGLNGLRKLHWDYKGEDSGWADSMKLAFYYVLKALCFVALIWSTVILWR